MRADNDAAASRRAPRRSDVLGCAVLCASIMVFFGATTWLGLRAIVLGFQLLDSLQH